MYIDVNGIKINTVSFGSGEDTFLGISGFVADWRVWMFVFEQLSTKMRCVGYDHRGSGESFAPAETISKQSYVNDLFSIMDKLGIEKCYLGGESFGGAVALLAALQQPERFKGLILIDTNLPNARPIDEDRKQFINFVKSDHQGAIEAFIDSVMPEPNIEHMKRMGVIESSHYLEKTLSDAELVVVKGAGHVPIVTRTQEVVDAIEKRFFTRK
jgi:pimeloyl-ACP methyl ester carboxylesterase